MAVKSMVTLAGIMTVGSLLIGCGLDGVRGTILAVEENRYAIREIGGKERRISIDEHPHRDGAKPGDEVRVFSPKMDAPPTSRSWNRRDSVRRCEDARSAA